MVAINKFNKKWFCVNVVGSIAETSWTVEKMLSHTPVLNLFYAWQSLTFPDFFWSLRLTQSSLSLLSQTVLFNLVLIWLQAAQLRPIWILYEWANTTQFWRFSVFLYSHSRKERNIWKQLSWDWAHDVNNSTLCSNISVKISLSYTMHLFPHLWAL